MFLKHRNIWIDYTKPIHPTAENVCRASQRLSTNSAKFYLNYNPFIFVSFNEQKLYIFKLPEEQREEVESARKNGTGWQFRHTYVLPFSLYLLPVSGRCLLNLMCCNNSPERKKVPFSVSPSISTPIYHRAHALYIQHENNPNICTKATQILC